MKFIRTALTAAFAVATLALVSLGSAGSASAGDFKCNSLSLTAVGTGLICDRNTTESDYKKDMKALHATLVEAGYPSAITVSSPAEFKIVNSGWKTRKVCGAIPMDQRVADNRVNVAKVTFCELTKKGYAIKKPKIVKAYKG